MDWKDAFMLNMVIHQTCQIFILNGPDIFEKNTNVHLWGRIICGILICHPVWIQLKYKWTYFFTKITAALLTRGFNLAAHSLFSSGLTDPSKRFVYQLFTCRCRTYYCVSTVCTPAWNHVPHMDVKYFLTFQRVLRDQTIQGIRGFWLPSSITWKHFFCCKIIWEKLAYRSQFGNGVTGLHISPIVNCFLRVCLTDFS